MSSLMNTLDQALEIRAIGSFISNHFKFAFTVGWFSYLAISGRFEVLDYLEKMVVKEMKYEIKRHINSLDYEIDKKFDKADKQNEERHRQVIRSHSKLFNSSILKLLETDEDEE